MFTLPAISATVASSTADAGSLVTAFLPVLPYALAIAVGTGVVLWLVRKLTGSARTIFKGKKGGRRKP